MNPTEEELRDVLATTPPDTAPPPLPDPPHPTPVDPVPVTTPPPATAAEVGQEIARALAANFGGVRTESAPPVQRKKTTRELIASFTPEQRLEFENRLQTGGAAAAMELADLIAKDQIDAFREEAQPMVNATGDLILDSFMREKADTDTYYRQIAPIFRTDTASLNTGVLVSMTVAQRRQQLGLLWDAAASKMFRNAALAAPTQPRPSNLGGGNGGTPGGQRRQAGIFEQGDDLTALAADLKRRGLVSDDDLTDVERTYQDAI